MLIHSWGQWALPLVNYGARKLEKPPALEHELVAIWQILHEKRRPREHALTPSYVLSKLEDFRKCSHNDRASAPHGRFNGVRSLLPLKF
ncbi:hypothetical protein F9C07_7447 [Aspergillus flavus]|uniref:Uncharacterized protein n=1 Tax=Aspergillus flavus (strain ATCC 200026 / FGSC A1120 / IAM 13836 / NRRL 3357 / JCM 12722 / SRRC 167) TaxID=332952 RepID=A0A7U2MMU9_ASPFN|nr:hypothetical protein F9C07_7447 [Aspergillus flavus]